MKKLLVLLLLLVPFAANAVTYEWTDEAGTVNFTEDLGHVPKKFRKKAKVLNGDDAPQIIVDPEPAKGNKEAGAPKKGGLSKEQLAQRNEYATAKANLKAAENEAAELRARLNDTSKMSRTEFLTLQNTLKQAEFRVQEQKKKVDQLRISAEKAGIPDN
jgi:hypothetical protein